MEKTETEKIQTPPWSEIRQTILAAFGYLLVAFLCLMAGIFFNSKKNPLEFSSFAILIPLLFFFLFWVYLYDYREKFKDLNWFSNSFYIIAFIAIVFVIDSFIKDRTYQIFFLFSCLPFTLLLFLLIRQIHNKYELPFRIFIFYPAILSCVIPFMNGFVRNDQIKPFIILSLFLTLALALFYKKKTYKSTSYLLVIVYVLFTGVSFYFYETYSINNIIIFSKSELEFIRAFLVAVNMAMVMGLTESWIFIKDPKNKNFTAESKGMGFYETWVKNATSIFPFIMPFLFLHKSFNSFSFIMVFFALFLYHFFENNFYKENNFRYWKNKRVLFGLLIPIFFSLSTLTNSVLDANRVFSLNSLNFIVFSIVGISMGILTILRISTEQNKITDHFTANRLLAVVICMLFCLISWGFEYYAQPQKIQMTQYAFKNLPQVLKLDSLEKDNKKALNQYFSIYKVDSISNMAFKESYLILDLDEKNNDELQKRAGITKLLYALLFVWLILGKPVKLVVEKISREKDQNIITQ